MIILHAAVLESTLYVWGESTPEARAAPRKKPGRKPKVPSPEPLPYDAGAEALEGVLSELGMALKHGKIEPSRMLLWIPTVDSTPIASSPLIAEPPESKEAVRLSPWAVSALPLPPPDALEFLCLCSGKMMLAPGIVAGDDVAFLTKAMHFAAALVARQQFLPGVENSQGATFARWEPIFSGPDSERLISLARAMPAAVRAMGSTADAPPAHSSVTVLSSFVAGMVDQLIRSSSAVDERKPATGRARRKAPVFDSVHDQWLHALRSPDGRMEGEEAELARFALQVKDWRRPVSLAATSPFKLCFRLEEPAPVVEEAAPKRRSRSPAADGEVWTVRYLLQASDDPSLLVPAEYAWTARGRRASVLKREDFNPREYLLSALGQASGICPNIEASLKGSAPSGYTLDTNGAFDLLTQKAWALEQAGFGVLLPAWWTRKGTKLKLTARASVKSPKLKSKAGLSLDTVVQFNWEVALGGDPLTRKELEELARLKSPLVKLRGQWVQLNAEEIQAALDFWKKQAEGETTAREVVRMAIGAESAPGGIPFEGVRASGWMAEVLSEIEGRTPFEELPPPDGFRGELRPYQVRGYSWLSFLRRWGLGACLADDMGLGKTIQALALIERDRESNGKRPVLLICPMSVVSNWQKEAARFTPDLRVMIHHGAGRTKGKAFQSGAKKQHVVISSYSLLHRDFEILKSIPWAGIVLDEAQNIKNPETKQETAARALGADYRLALTGTPVENNVGDLWSIMEFLNPGFLGGQSEFRRRFFIPIQANRDVEATERLKRVTGPFILRRLKTDKTIIADLPEKMEMKVFCSLTREQASLYEAVVKDAARALDETEGIQRRGLVLATLLKLKQVCNHPAQFLGDNSSVPGRSGKLARLTEMLEEIIETGDRALIFSQFTEMGDILRRHLQETFGREVLFLHGGVPKKQRDRMIERFQAEYGPPFFLLSLKAGGTGLNLTKANHVFHFDRWWNPAVESQATDRAFRIGQVKNVQVHKFICAGTLEERIDELIESKREISEGVVGAGEAWLTELSTAELKNLFALGKDAVAE